MRSRKRWSRKKRAIVLVAVASGILAAPPLVARMCIHLSTRGRVYADVADVPESRVALVLGAGIRSDGTPSDLLRDRLDKAVDLYKAGKVARLLVSGDNRFVYHNEPAAMRKYLVEHGVATEDIRSDYAGRRTYDSIYRARHIFGLSELVVVSQGFHLDRALFLCDKLGIRAWGLAADRYSNARATVRECAACLGAVFDVYVLHPKPIMGQREEV